MADLPASPDIDLRGVQSTLADILKELKAQAADRRERAGNSMSNPYSTELVDVVAGTPRKLPGVYSSISVIGSHTGQFVPSLSLDEIQVSTDGAHFDERLPAGAVLTFERPMPVWIQAGFNGTVEIAGTIGATLHRPDPVGMRIILSAVGGPVAVGVGATVTLATCSPSLPRPVRGWQFTACVECTTDGPVYVSGSPVNGAGYDEIRIMKAGQIATFESPIYRAKGVTFSNDLRIISLTTGVFSATGVLRAVAV